MSADISCTFAETDEDQIAAGQRETTAQTGVKLDGARR
jgi:predicted NUDIX family NTP pyrophosphohydrolase